MSVSPIQRDMPSRTREQVLLAAGDNPASADFLAFIQGHGDVETRLL